MKPSRFLRSLSLHIPARLLASPAVVPLPIQTPFGQQVTAELDNLRSEGCEHASTAWLGHVLEASSTTQKIALKSLSNIVVLRDLDRKAIDEYLDSSVALLDACNNLSEKMQTIQNYVESLKIVSKLLEGQCEPNPTCLARAKDLLDSCEATERRSYRFKSSSGSVKKLFNYQQESSSELNEILVGSEALASMACRVLNIALSFKSTRGVPTRAQQVTSTSCCSWLSSLFEMQTGTKNDGTLILRELTETMKATKNLRDQIKCGKHTLCVQELKMRSVDLEKGIKPLEERVKELYKLLIAVRMALLGILSKA